MATDESTTTSPREAAASAADGKGAATTASAGAAPAQAQAQAEERRESTSRTSAHETGEKPRKKRIWLRVVIIVLVTILVVVAVLAALFAWDRWYRYDDAADIQGDWYPAGSLAKVEIGPDTIAFDSETAYDYTIDTHDKTISFALGPLQGEGRYWFGDDRATLVIEDGEVSSASETALADLSRLFANLGATITGNPVALPEGDGISVFTRTPDPAVVAAKEEADREALRKEEAARQAEEDAARAEREAREQAEREAAEAEAAEAEAEAAQVEDGEEDSEPTGEAAAEEEPQDFANESMGIFE